MQWLILSQPLSRFARICDVSPDDGNTYQELSKSIRDEQGKFNGKLTWYKIRKFLWLIGSQQRNDCELDEIPR
jgi:hypothetical protein